jgi:hypothetical protein
MQCSQKTRDRTVRTRGEQTEQTNNERELYTYYWLDESTNQIAI